MYHFNKYYLVVSDSIITLIKKAFNENGSLSFIVIHYIKKEDTVIFSLVINPINLYNHFSFYL